MSIQRISQSSALTVQPIGASGTYTLSVALEPGFYRLTTDTTQNLSTTQLLFQTTGGYKFGAAVRGGLGYVAVPVRCEQVQFTAGTFPLLLGMERISTYNLIAAPTVSNSDVTWTPLPTVKFDLAFTLPPTATGIGIYWSNGTFTDLGTTTSPKTAITPPTTPTFATAYPMMIVAKDANGVWGLGQVINPALPYQVFTINGTYTPPSGSTTADVWVIAGGGGGGANNYTSNLGNPEGGGGAGGYRTATALATPGAVSVVVGAGGAGGAAGFNPSNPGVKGGNSSFGSIVATGGGYGGAYTSTGPGTPGGPGGSGGGGGSGATGGGAGGTGNEGGYTPVEGYNGSAGSSSAAGGGGGAGGAASGTGNTSYGPGVTLFGTVYARGGAQNGQALGTYGSGGYGAGTVGGGNGGGGAQGVVLVKANGV